MSDWLLSRTPTPPHELKELLLKAAADSCASLNDLPSTLVEKALAVLANVGDGRTAAPHLLAADALITYAMEAAAEAGNIEEVAANAMRELSAIK